MPTRPFTYPAMMVMVVIVIVVVVVAVAVIVMAVAVAAMAVVAVAMGWWKGSEESVGCVDNQRPAAERGHNYDC